MGYLILHLVSIIRGWNVCAQFIGFANWMKVLNSNGCFYTRLEI